MALAEPELTTVALDVRACARLAQQIESHATALRSWAGILLTRLQSSRQPNVGTLEMLHDISTAMTTEAEIATGLARKLSRQGGVR